MLGDNEQAFINSNLSLDLKESQLGYQIKGLV